MGFLRILKFWDVDTVIESTIETVIKDFNRYKQKAPDRDPHYWLASAFSHRRGYRPGKDVGLIIPFTRTTIFSVLGDCAPLALAYYFLSLEMPHAVPKFEKKWEEVLQPANDLIARREFVKTWERVNSWTRENIPGMQEVIAEMEKAL
jgi:hypothetical protein